MPDGLSPRNDLDIVVLGATGMAGREVLRHLGPRAAALGLRWGAAGRDVQRVKATAKHCDVAPAAVLEVDVTEHETVDALVARTRVVVNTVGPYARYGAHVYRACAQTGTHLVDLSGETEVTRRMVESLDQTATDHGAIIVPAAGFESAPFDLGVLFAASALRDRTGRPVASATAVVSTATDLASPRLTDAVSGGTYLSMLAAADAGLTTALTDPYCLDTATSAANGRYDLRPRRSLDDGRWLAPMVPAPFINPPIVHRTASLLRDAGDDLFSPAFRYEEAMRTTGMAPEALSGPAATVLALGTSALAGIARLPRAARRRVVDLLARIGPAPGDGPREEDLDRWSFRIDIEAVDIDGTKQRAVIDGEGNPGYRATSKMAAELGLALADPEADLPTGAGFLTPATALGRAGLGRLESAGLSFRLL